MGDTVYLENTAFLIDEIRDSEVSLRDPTLAYPIFRTESKENFERLLRRDDRNLPITVAAKFLLYALAVHIYLVPNIIPYGVAIFRFNDRKAFLGLGCVGGDLLHIG